MYLIFLILLYLYVSSIDMENIIVIYKGIYLMICLLIRLFMLDLLGNLGLMLRLVGGI